MPAHDGLDLDLLEAVRVEHSVVGAEQQRLEGHLRALVLVHAVDDERVALLDAVLLAAYFHDCVHQEPMRIAITPRPSWPPASSGRGRRGARGAVASPPRPRLLS